MALICKKCKNLLEDCSCADVKIKEFTPEENKRAAFNGKIIRADHVTPVKRRKPKNDKDKKS